MKEVLFFLRIITKMWMKYIEAYDKYTEIQKREISEPSFILKHVS